MERTLNTNIHDPGRDGTSRVCCFRGRSMSPAPADERVGADSQEIAVFNHIPVFLDRTFRMIDNVPDDVVCWSRAGDSFIIKQVLAFEEILPSYFNHKKFASFVRQLNFYGFKKTKARAAACMRYVGHHKDSACGNGAEAAAKESESWEEFRHPLFRRGRRDLLTGIKRQKDGGRLKRKRADAEKSDVVSTLEMRVEALSGDLKAMKGKLDSVMSLVRNIAGRQNRSIPGDAAHGSRDNVKGGDEAAAAVAAVEGKGRAGAGGRASFGGGAQSGPTVSFVDAAEPPAATARGGYGQWLWGAGSGGESGGGGGSSIRKGGHNTYAYGTVLDYRAAPRDPVDRQQHGWQGDVLPSRLPQQPHEGDAGRYPVMPSQKRYHVENPQRLPPLSAAVKACALESTSIEASRQQLPPIRLSPSERKQGGGIQRSHSPNVGHPCRGDGSGRAVDTDPSSAPADADTHDEAQQHQRWGRPQDSSMHPTQETAKVVDSPGGRRRGAAAAGNQTQQSLSDGTGPMLHALSATSAAETDSTSSTGSTDTGIHSTSTQSPFEYD